MNEQLLKNIVESALLAAGRPLRIDHLLDLFEQDQRPERSEVRKALESLQADYEDRGLTLKEVASGFRIQVKPAMGDWLNRLWQERPPRYSRALLETLALIAYRQPLTRGEIEDVRGVAVSTNIMRTLLERHWVRVVGHRDVPGRPALYATTREFLDYFSMKSLDELPPLTELKDFDNLTVELDLAYPEQASEAPSSDETETPGTPELSADSGEESASLALPSIDDLEVPTGDTVTVRPLTEEEAAKTPEEFEADRRAEAEEPKQEGIKATEKLS